MNMCSYSCCVSGSWESANIKALSSLLKLVGEENRLRLLCVLQDGEHCVCEFADHLQGVSQSLVSHHLADLRTTGLISSRKDGLRAYYSLTEKGRQVTETIFELTASKHCSGATCKERSRNRN